MEKVKEFIKLKQNEIKLNVPDIEIQTKKPMKKREIENTNSSIGNKSTMDSISFKNNIDGIKHLLNNNEYEEFVDLTKEINPQYIDNFADEKDVETQIFDLIKMKNEKKIPKKIVKDTKKYITKQQEEDDDDFNYKSYKEKIDNKKSINENSKYLAKPTLSKMEKNDDKILRKKA